MKRKTVIIHQFHLISEHIHLQHPEAKCKWHDNKKALITKCKVCLLPEFHAFYIAKTIQNNNIVLRGRMPKT